MRKNELLRRSKDIERVLFRGKRLQNGALRVYYAPAAEPGSRRAAFITSGKFPSAVIRNRVRRRLREIFRTSKEQFPLNHDFILRADRTVADIEFAALKETVVGLAGRIPPAVEKSENRSSKS